MRSDDDSRECMLIVLCDCTTHVSLILQCTQVCICENWVYHVESLWSDARNITISRRIIHFIATQLIQFRIQSLFSWTFYLQTILAVEAVKSIIALSYCYCAVSTVTMLSLCCCVTMLSCCKRDLIVTLARYMMIFAQDFVWKWMTLYETCCTMMIDCRLAAISANSNLYLFFIISNWPGQWHTHTHTNRWTCWIVCPLTTTMKRGNDEATKRCNDETMKVTSFHNFRLLTFYSQCSRTQQRTGELERQLSASIHQRLCPLLFQLFRDEIVSSEFAARSFSGFLLFRLSFSFSLFSWPQLAQHLQQTVASNSSCPVVPLREFNLNWPSRLARFGLVSWLKMH